jgi:hypothetical protein
MSQPRLMNPAPSPELVQQLARQARAQRSAVVTGMLKRLAQAVWSLVRAAPAEKPAAPRGRLATAQRGG